MEERNRNEEMDQRRDVGKREGRDGEKKDEIKDQRKLMVERLDCRKGGVKKQMNEGKKGKKRGMNE